MISSKGNTLKIKIAVTLVSATTAGLAIKLAWFRPNAPDFAIKATAIPVKAEFVSTIKKLRPYTPVMDVNWITIGD